MTEDILTLKAKQAMRSYMLRLVALPGVISVITAFTLGFFVNFVAKESAYNTAFTTASTDIMNLMSEANRTNFRTGQQAQEISDILKKVRGTHQQSVELQKKLEKMQIYTDANNFIDSAVENLKKDDEFIGKISDEARKHNVYHLGSIECSVDAHEKLVPIKGTTTDDWLVIFTGLTISSLTQRRKASADNAIFSIAATAHPGKAKQSWTIRYYVEINRDSDGKGTLNLESCPDTVGHINAVAIRAYGGVQEIQ